MALSPGGKSAVRAYAATVNLQPGDLPGLTVVSPEREAPAPTANGLAMDRCYGDLGDKYHVAKVDSAKFASVSGAEHVEIYSNVEVMPTAALAARNNAVGASPRAISCAEHFLPRALASEDGPRVHYGHLTIRHISIPLPGGYGVSMTVSILGVPAAIEPTQPHLYTDAFAFLVGRAEVALVDTAFPRPVPAAEESRLLSLLYARASTHKL